MATARRGTGASREALCGSSRVVDPPRRIPYRDLAHTATRQHHPPRLLQVLLIGHNPSALARLVAYRTRPAAIDPGKPRPVVIPQQHMPPLQRRLRIRRLDPAAHPKIPAGILRCAGTHVTEQLEILVKKSRHRRRLYSSIMDQPQMNTDQHR